MIIGSSALAKRVRNVLNARFPKCHFFTPQPKSRWPQLKKRIKRHGLWVAAGQVGFRALHQRIARSSQARIDDIWRDATLDSRAPEDHQITWVEDVNAPAVHDLLRTYDPDVVFVFGVPRISARTLAQTTAPFVNLHPGITPDYRGVHTGYWALYENDPDRFGATVHYVDEGLDTGPVLRHIPNSPTPADNVSTYNHLLCAKALPEVCDILAVLLDGGQVDAVDAGPAKPIFFEPTLWRYMSGKVLGVAR